MRTPHRRAITTLAAGLAVTGALVSCGTTHEVRGTTLPTLPERVLETTVPATAAPTTTTTVVAPSSTFAVDSSVVESSTTTLPGGRIHYTREPTIGPLHIGYNGPRVRQLQGRLAGLGYQLSVDGYFGRGTEAALREFQATQGLPADGIDDTDTDARLISLTGG